MPSPTSRTVPTSLRVTSGENCSISRWITELISSALNFMRLSFDQALAKLGESVLHRRIVKLIADLDDQAPNQVGIGRDRDDGRAVDQAGQPLLEGIQPGRVERDRRADPDRNPPVPPVPEGPGFPQDRPQDLEPAVAVEDSEEPQHQPGGTALEDLAEHPILQI